MLKQLWQVISAKWLKKKTNNNKKKNNSYVPNQYPANQTLY